MKSISDTVRNTLGISPDIECIETDGKPVIRIAIRPSEVPVDCGGKFYKRVSDTVQEMRGSELTKLYFRATT
jgi:predicted HTH transcriptional regulator